MRFLNHHRILSKVFALLGLTALISIPHQTRALFWESYHEHFGWRLAHSFGWVHAPDSSGWALHTEFGWIFSDSLDEENIWFLQSREWLWTSMTLFPWIWQDSEERWLYFDRHMTSYAGLPGVFRIPDTPSWFRNEYWDQPLPNAHLQFERKLIVENADPEEVVALEYVFDLDAIIAYLEANPKGNGQPYEVLESINPESGEAVFYWEDFSRDEQRELRAAVEHHKRTFQQKIIHKQISLQSVTVLQEEFLSAPLSGAGILFILITGEAPVYYQAIWIS